MIRPKIVPHSLAFELTPRCDQQCAYCYNVWKGRAGAISAAEPLDTEAFAGLIRRAVHESGCSNLCLTGGDPLLRSDALQLLGVAASLGPVVLITNGAHVSEAVADAIASRQSVGVQLTLLAADRELHDSIRGRRNFDVAIDALTALRERRVAVTVCFVCTRRNGHALRGVLDLAYAAGVRDVAFNRMVPAGHGAQRVDELAPTMEQIERCLADAEELAPRYGLRVTTGIPIPPCLAAPERYPNVSFTGCSSGTSEPNLVVDYQGNVRPCNVSPVILGNLCRQSWRAATSGDYLRRFARVRPAICRHCALGASCRGGCKEAAHACYGSLEEEEPLLRLRRRHAGAG
jgi:radical SAM protein with 4Fe4S-binding SPASM domain